jgi:hypothetical protein
MGRPLTIEGVHQSIAGDRCTGAARRYTNIRFLERGLVGGAKFLLTSSQGMVDAAIITAHGFFDDFVRREVHGMRGA